MYAHEVVTQIKKLTHKKSKYFLDDIEHFEYLKFLKTAITDSHKIHLGHLNDYKNIIENMSGNLFYGDNATGVKCPYDRIWFDFLVDAIDSDNKEDRINNIKVGIYVEQLLPDVLICSVCTYDVYSNVWVVSPTSHLYVINEKIKNRPEVVEFLKLKWPHLDVLKLFGDSNYAFLFTSSEFHKMASNGKKGWEAAQEILNYDLSEISTVNMALKLLCCRNIMEEEVKPTKTVIKKKRKVKVHDKRKFVYKVLNLKLPKKRNKYKSGESQTESSRRVHFCRGHFRTYTEEAPMCGKYVGVVWVPSHVRGNSKKGMVVKTYDVKPTKYNPVMVTA